jgi:hypothetical protein
MKKPLAIFLISFGALGFLGQLINLLDKISRNDGQHFDPFSLGIGLIVFGFYPIWYGVRLIKRHQIDLNIKKDEAKQEGEY